MKQIFISKNEKQTKAIASKLASELKFGDVVLLEGDLGSGKTVFTKGIAEKLGVKDIITSPTFTILNLYKIENGNFAHFDMYRIENESELSELGFEEYIGGQATICAIEWSSQTPSIIPKNSITVTLEKVDEKTRKIFIERIV